MSVIAPPVASNTPGGSTRLTIAAVVIASAVLATVLNHLGDTISAEATATTPSPSSMF